MRPRRSASLSGVVDDLVPGGNFAAALSYGDLTSAGVGTTTYVCDGQALAFGHPMLFSGRTSLGAGSADAIAIVPDALGPYKLANVTSPVGTLDQDRLAGIRAVDGEPPSIPITTAITSLDSDNSHVGETDVVFKEAYPDFAFSHIFSSIDSVFDKIGVGLGVLQLDDRRQARGRDPVGAPQDEHVRLGVRPLVRIGVRDLRRAARDRELSERGHRVHEHRRRRSTSRRPSATTTSRSSSRATAARARRSGRSAPSRATR